MDTHTLRILEYEKIKELLAERATSSLGAKRALELYPLTNLDTIQRSLASVSELKTIIITGDDLPIYGLHDVTNGMYKASIDGALLNSNELWELVEVITATHRLKNYFRGQDKLYPQLYNLTLPITRLPKLEEVFYQMLEVGGIIKDNATSQLKSIRKDIESIRQRILNKLHQISQNLKGLANEDNIITIRDNRYVIPIRQGARGKIKGIIHDQSASGATVYIEPSATIELNNQLRIQKMAEKREIERILRELTSKIYQNWDAININIEIASEIDLIYAKSTLSLAMEANEPIINNEGKIYLENARHPLLLSNADFDRHSVIPLTLWLGEQFNTLLITGPNTGGKTVALKTIGLLTLMTQSGLHIPASDRSQIAVFEDILADIGDEQSIEQNLSTFSSHMRQIVNMTKECSFETLLLIDELGAGTDPEEGSALGMALLEYLSRFDARIICTTHYGALKIFVHSHLKMENASMEFDQKTLLPTYVIRIGIPGSSYALAIAKRLGINEKILKSASEYVNEGIRDLESLLSNLEEKLLIYDKKVKTIERRESDLIKIADKYTRKLNGLKNKEKQIEEKANKEAKKFIKETKTKLDKLIKEIKQNQANEKNEKNILKAKKIIKETEIKIDKKLKIIVKNPIHRKKLEIVKLEDFVWVENMKQIGCVLEIKEDDEIIIEIGRMRIRTNIENLCSLEPEEIPIKKVIPKKSSIVIPEGKDLSLDLDLRGHKVEEALPIVDKYLDDAFLNGMPFIHIIHGKGTGALREAITRMLKKHPRVREFRLGEDGEGGSGCTVVYLKE